MRRGRGRRRSVGAGRAGRGELRRRLLLVGAGGARPAVVRGPAIEAELGARRRGDRLRRWMRRRGTVESTRARRAASNGPARDRGRRPRRRVRREGALSVVLDMLDRAVDRHAASRQRGGAGRDGRHLARGHGLGRRLQLDRRHRRPIVQRADQGLVDPREQPARRLGVVGARRDRGRRQQRGQRGRALAQSAQRRAAGGAVAQMRPRLGELGGLGLAVDERREQRLPTPALLARLDPRVALEEAPPALGDAAVDLRVGPSAALGDLLVAVSLRLQPQGT